MIKNIDFTPQITRKGGFFKSDEIENFESTVDQMNEWIGANNPDIINVETVVLPNIHNSDEEGSGDTMLRTGKDGVSHWYQLIRIWYRA